MTDAARVITIDLGAGPSGSGGIPPTAIVAGDSGPVFEIGHRTSASIRSAIVLADLDPNYSCWFAVAEADPAILRAVTDKAGANTRFRASLTPAETAALGPGIWHLALELRNPTLDPPLIAEKQGWLTIAPGIVEAPAPTPGGAAAGTFDFSFASQSGLLALILEDF